MDSAFAVFLVLLVLKLSGLVSLSWWLVTAPLWISVALLLFIFLVGIAIGLLRS